MEKSTNHPAQIGIIYLSKQTNDAHFIYMKNAGEVMEGTNTVDIILHVKAAVEVLKAAVKEEDKTIGKDLDRSRRFTRLTEH